MDPLARKSLSLYRSVLRQLHTLRNINQQDGRRAKLVGMVPAEEIKSEVMAYMRQQYQVHERQLHSGKIERDKVEARVKRAKRTLVGGLRHAVEDLSHEKNKRKHIEQSPFLFLLGVFTRRWGNAEYKAQLVQAFQKLTNKEKEAT